VGDGLRRLNDELRRLGARRIVISSNLRLRTDGLPVASQSKMLADPGVAVYFKLKDQPRVLACDRWFSAADNMAAIAGHIAAIRTQERYGVGTLEQAFAGYAALPAVGESGGGNWRIELELAEVPIHQITAAVVEERYRALAKQRHPDLPGGSHEAMARLSTAVQSARRYFEVQR
jgi:hypothetical protein